LARLGGDEFAILLPGATAQAAQVAADRLLETLARHSVNLHGQPHSVTGSVGIALYPRHAGDSTELLAKSDRAMYRAKEQGRNRAHLFDPSDDGEFAPTEGEAWTQRIRESLDHGYFLLHAQPIMDLVTSEVSRYELLLRMNYRGNSMVQPGSFLNIAERSGLIRDIDRWVVREGLQLAAHLQDHALAPRPGVIVNLSSRAFGDPELLTLLKEELESSRLDPGRLVLEITETAAIADFDEASRFIGALRDLGCRFSVDDFGAGFSSFSYLKHLPLTYLKIDGMYIENLVHNPVDQHMVRAMVELSRGLGIETIAEWVPDEETVGLLRRLGVGHAQGYYIGMPRALDDWFPSLTLTPA
jgi:predicted signal transduction protein with EAL and GGDEF domain